MRGTFFNKPFEINITTDKDSYSQGDVILAQVKVINHGSDELDFPLSLALIDLKKKEIKETLQTFKLQVGDNSFEIKIPSDSPITSKAATLSLLFKDDTSSLHINVVPNFFILKTIEVFENFFRFKVKTLKDKKNTLEYKFSIPTSKEYGFIDDLVLAINLDSELNLNFEYRLKIKKLEYVDLGVQNKVASLKIKRSLKPSEYRAYETSLAQDFMISNIKEVLLEAKGKNLFA